MNRGHRLKLALQVLVATALCSTLAAQPPTQVDLAETCLACHDDVAGQISSPVKHPPAEGGECSACHNPHASRHSALLLQRPAILCVECHAEVTEAISRPYLHEPVAGGLCGECHQPHGSSHQNLLLEAGEALCQECHADVVHHSSDRKPCISDPGPWISQSHSFPGVQHLHPTGWRRSLSLKTRWIARRPWARDGEHFLTHLWKQMHRFHPCISQYFLQARDQDPKHR